MITGSFPQVLGPTRDGNLRGVTLYTNWMAWTHSDSAHYFTTMGGDGPRATPTIAGGRVYTFGATGILNCLELAGGNVVWTKNLAHEHSAPLPSWGFAGSPLIHEG